METEIIERVSSIQKEKDELELVKRQLCRLLPGYNAIDKSLSTVDVLRGCYMYIFFQCMHQELDSDPEAMPQLTSEINKTCLWDALPCITQQMMGRAMKSITKLEVCHI